MHHVLTRMKMYKDFLIFLKNLSIKDDKLLVIKSDRVYF